MGGDPRRDTRIGGGGRGRMDRPPGWKDGLLVGRSRADREAEQDLMVRAIVLIGGVVGLLLFGLNTVFAAVGLQFGLWSAPAFVPVCTWLFVCAVTRRTWRPVEFDVLCWSQRFGIGGVLLVVLWLVWPLWAGPTAKAWRAAHGGFASVKLTGAPSFPLHIALGSSPIAMGLIAFLLLGLGMVLAPSVQRDKRREWPGPPADPEPLRAPLASPRPPNRAPSHPRPRDPRWP